jgi:hypothetical protein
VHCALAEATDTGQHEHVTLLRSWRHGCETRVPLQEEAKLARIAWAPIPPMRRRRLAAAGSETSTQVFAIPASQPR